MFNIYNDLDVAEISKCAPLLKKLKLRVEQLINDWPDNPNLVSLVNMIDRMLSGVSVSQTIVYMATSLESMLSVASTWETVAAKHVSLRDQLAPLKQLLIHWRSLELKFWRESMMFHKRRIEMSVSRFWFSLFALFVQTFNGKNTVSQLIDALFNFLHTSPLGEFQARLDLLTSWANYCSFFDQSKLSATVTNIVQYHSAVVQRIEKAIKSEIDLLKQDLKSFVKIQQWRDFNIFSLKESVQRCKVKIRKVLTNYDKVLQREVTEHLVLDTESKEKTESEVIPQKHKLEVDLSEC